MRRQVASTDRGLGDYPLATSRSLGFYAPSGIAIRSPCSADSIQLLVYGEVVEAKSVFELVCHCNAGRAGANDDGIQ